MGGKKGNRESVCRNDVGSLAPFSQKGKGDWFGVKW